MYFKTTVHSKAQGETVEGGGGHGKTTGNTLLFGPWQSDAVRRTPFAVNLNPFKYASSRPGPGQGSTAAFAYVCPPVHSPRSPVLPLTLKTIWLGQGHHSVSLSLPSASRPAPPRILLCFLTRFCRRHRHPTLTRVGSYGAAMGKRT